eukprot:4518747-Pyramimonas_sp.AAC.1
MRQADASDVCESTPVITSHQHCSPPQRALREETESTSEDDSTNTNSFASLDRAADRVQSSGIDRRTHKMILNRFDLARLTDRVQTSGFNRRTRLIILHRLAVLISSVAVLELE